MNIKRKLKCIILGEKEQRIFKRYYKKFKRYSFVDLHCKDKEQYEASITRLYHTIEKGLSYDNFRAGFGKDNISILMKEMEAYSKLYDTSKFFYKTALSTLNEYIKKNKEYGYIDKNLEERISNLPGEANECGGIIKFSVPNTVELNYEELIKSRHSIRHFSSKPLEVEQIKKAIALAQYTPSACNRQGWKSYVIEDRDKINILLGNQNGNRGFGHEFDKLILITGDLRAFNHDREVFQVFIDGGMYAMRVLDSLYYNNIAACPLSAALTPIQEQNARNILQLHEAEIFIMYIGVGNYPEKCQTTKSERHEPNVTII